MPALMNPPILRSLILLLVTATATLHHADAQNANPIQDKYYRAFYMETAQGDLDAAAKLYGEIVADKAAPAAVATDAKARLAGVKEELAAADFAKLVPPTTLAYAEINRPGQQLSRLLDQLGLLGTAKKTAGQAADTFAVSPLLVNELLGLRGVAVAITGFDMQNQQPSGVAILHPGNLDVVRGLIDTALPASARPIDAIGGFPTYSVEGEVIVTLTNRLILVSQQAGEIQNVIDRLRDPSEDSLASSGALAESLKGREDALLFFCVNAKPIMPMIDAAMQMGGNNREVALAQAILDPKSLESLSGRIGVSNDGLFLDLSLRLAKGHKNLVYNFIRGAAIDAQTMKRIPSGSAMFLAWGMNPANSRFAPTAAKPGDEPVPVSAMDIGREIFGNIISVAAFVTPPDGAVSVKRGGFAMPDTAIALTVHDPAKTEALWGQVLGLASIAAGVGTMEGTRTDIDGVSVRTFRFPEGISAYFAISGNDVIIASSEQAVRKSLLSTKNSAGIGSDAAFAKSLSRIGPDSTFAAFMHPGRCAEIAKLYMDKNEIAEMEPFTKPMAGTVASLVVNHSNNVLNVSGRVTGLPNMGGVVAQLIRHHREEGQQQGTLNRALAQRDYPGALAAVEQHLSADSSNTDLLWTKLQLQAKRLNDEAGAEQTAGQLFDAIKDDANELNDRAWEIVSQENWPASSAAIAIRFSQRSNELTKNENWMYVDTLAHAYFKAGQVQKAVEIEQKAVKLAGNSSRSGEAVAALKRFQSQSAGGGSPAQEATVDEVR